MARFEDTASVSAITRPGVQPVSRRNLRQQARRFALTTAIGLAAATGATLLTPEQAMAVRL